ncbi:MAG: archaemetzincin [Acidobacteriia bacterium]|nr:archaemetzincin [Terriglobia bacterium]
MTPQQFTPPGRQERAEAIGSIQHLPQTVQRLLDPGAFAPMEKPFPQDWLSNHFEPGQTCREFLRSHPNFPDARRGTLYLLPLEEFGSGGPALPKLQSFAEAFFSMRVKLLSAPPMHNLRSITRRENPETGRPQLLTADLLKYLKLRLPGDAYCLLGITLHDLYPDPKWNFVFGEASLRERVGVYSFARYDPGFYGIEGTSPAERSHLILRRSFAVLAHETSHMFGLAHCIYFRCVMNGSNSLPEADSRPLRLCPVDLRKLYESVRFDPVARYAHLRDFFHEAGFPDEAAWIEKELARVTG